MAVKRRHAKRRDGDVHRSWTFPLHPTAEQAETMSRWIDGCRWLWNQAVEHQQRRRRAGARAESIQDLMVAIPSARLFDGSPLDGVPGTWAQGTLKQLGDGWELHWSKVRAGKRSRPPGFRSAQRAQSVRFAVQKNSGPASPDSLVRAVTTGGVRFSEVRVVKLGWVRARIDRPLPPEALCGSMVVRCDEAGRWWVTFQIEIPAPEREQTGKVAGVDRGVVHSLVTDEGQVFDMPGLTAGERRRRRKLERSLSRTRRMNPCPADQWAGKRLIRGHCECAQGGCWKTSGRYQARKRSLAGLKAREVRRHDDAAHKASAALAAVNDVVVFEALDVQAMTRSARGTTEAPGRNVAQKRGLNRAILAQAWGSVKAKTAYKTIVVEVDPKNSSRECHECGHTDKASRRSQAEFRCTSCGHEANADVNAAKNIRARGLATISHERGTAATQAVAGRGGDPVAGPVNRQRSRREALVASMIGLALVPASWGIKPRDAVRQSEPLHRAAEEGALGRSGLCNVESPTICPVQRVRLAPPPCQLSLFTAA